MRLFRKRWFVSFLGLSLVSVLLWLYGSQFAFGDWEPWASPASRAFTICLIYGVWIGKVLVRFLMARAASGKVMEAILGKAPETAVAGTPLEAEQEVAALEQRIQQAVTLLKKNKDSHWPGSQFLYQLPWYILIGPPGSGKTTALVNSSLKFLVTDEGGRGQELRGVHGTRDCDWFFTDQAVLLDTAGRYVTQDSREAVDSAAWQGFLDLLKGYRKRRPINGVLVCVSLPDIATQSEAKTQRDSQAIRLRIRELHDRLGIRFPIYLLFTKCDLLAGFTEFFDDLSKDERQQVWGMTYPIDIDYTRLDEHFKQEFDALEGRINNRLVDRLEHERDAQRRALIYGFPQQFASVRNAASRFLDETFEPTRYEMPATLRGVYFTSGTQMGSPLDRLTASLATSFGLHRETLPAFTGPGRSYFVGQLMRDVVFNEAGLANTDIRWERRRLWLQRGAVGATLALTGVAASAWTLSYYSNQAYIDSMSEQAVKAKVLVEGLAANDKTLASALPALNAIRTLPAGYESEPGLLSSIGHLGLDQRDQLGAEARLVYRKVLRTLLLPRLVLHLEARIKDSAASMQALYAGLRTYLMLDDPEHFSAASVRTWLDADLRLADSPRLDKQQRDQLLAHLDALFERGLVDLPLDLDTHLIAQARMRLAGMSLAERVYAQIMDAKSPWQGIADFRAAEAISNYTYVFAGDKGNPLPGVVDRRYTLHGYKKFKEQIDEAADKLAGESWIIGEGFASAGEGGDLERVRARVLDTYLKDYRQRWEDFLDAITLAPMGKDLNKAIDVLRILAADASPIKQLLIAVERETTLVRADNLKDKGLRAGRGLLDRVSDAAGDLFATPSEVPVGSGDLSREYPVDRAFKALNALVRPEQEGPAPIEVTLGLLAELKSFLTAAQKMPGDELVGQVKRLQNDSVIGQLNLLAERQPPQLKKWLEVVTWQVSQILGERALTHLNAEWRSSVFAEFQRGLKGRYPLAKRSERDVTLEDFGEFFGPGGSIDRFFSEHLEDLVNTSSRVWRLQPNSPIHISRETLITLQRAALIRKAFFASREKEPLVQFNMKPISMDVSIDEFLLDIDGQQLRFDHSATKPMALSWPGAAAAGEVRIRLSPPSAGASSGLTLEGPWAWFRLLDRSKVSRLGTAERLEVAFDVGGRKAFYELRAGSTLNPFQLSALERFRCPEML